MLNKPIIFTDLDGTLLDHHSYSFEPAREMLTKLQANQIPVIPTTSKTFAELLPIRQQIGLDGPFIVENGAAVNIPIGYFANQPKNTICKKGFWVKEFSKPRTEWLAKLTELKQRFVGQFEHFSSMSELQISKVTGLSPQQALLAKTREYGEPVLWLSSQKSKALFIQALIELGAQPLQGGRFLHVSGACDKGQALEWLQTQYNLMCDIQTTSIALGDSQNDVAMLEAANIAVRILSPVNPPPALNRLENIYTSEEYGPKGWSNCLQNIIFNSPNSSEVQS